MTVMTGMNVLLITVILPLDAIIIMIHVVIMMFVRMINVIVMMGVIGLILSIVRIIRCVPMITVILRLDAGIRLWTVMIRILVRMIGAMMMKVANMIHIVAMIIMLVRLNPVIPHPLDVRPPLSSVMIIIIVLMTDVTVKQDVYTPHVLILTATIKANVRPNIAILPLDASMLK